MIDFAKAARGSNLGSMASVISESRAGRKIAIDLCCGKGGWARGLLAAGFDEVIGYDVEDFSADYPGSFIRFDVNRLDGSWFRSAALIVASPDCYEYSLHSMPWASCKRLATRPPDLRLFQAVERICKQSNTRFVIENVRGAQKYHGRSCFNYGAFHLWTNFSLLVPGGKPRSKMRISGAGRGSYNERSLIPFELSYHVGRFALALAR